MGCWPPLSLPRSATSPMMRLRCPAGPRRCSTPARDTAQSNRSSAISPSVTSSRCEARIPALVALALDTCHAAC
jgi:hypothetical protein